MKILICICCLTLTVLASHGADFDLGAHGTLSVNVPADWSVKGKPVNDSDGVPLGYAFAFKPNSDANAKCLLTFIYPKGGASDKEAIRKEIMAFCEEFVSGSVEKKKTLQDFALEKGYGAYCVFTDASLVSKKPKPGDYKVMGSGEVKLADDLLGAVSLFADEADGKEFKAMIAIINSLKVKPRDAK
jgi:hypothetical protein